MNFSAADNAITSDNIHNANPIITISHKYPLPIPIMIDSPKLQIITEGSINSRLVPMIVRKLFSVNSDKAAAIIAAEINSRSLNIYCKTSIPKIVILDGASEKSGNE